MKAGAHRADRRGRVADVAAAVFRNRRCLNNAWFERFLGRLRGKRIILIHVSTSFRGERRLLRWPRIPLSDEVKHAPRLRSRERSFASSGDETRVVRAADWVLLVASALVFAVAAWATGDRTDLEQWINSIFAGAPGWLTSIATVIFAFSGLVIIGLLALLASRRTRSALFRDAYYIGPAVPC